MGVVTSLDGTTIAFDRSGEGPAVVFVAGALSDRAHGRPLAALLAGRFTVYTYDRRGRGDSGDTPPYTIRKEVEDLASIIAEVGGPVSLFGHSSGAVLALEAAASGLAVRKLALYEPPFIVDDSRPPLSEQYITRLPELLAVGRRGDAVELFMTLAAGVPSEAVARMRQSPAWSMLETLAPTLAYDEAIMAGSMGGSVLPLRRWAAVAVPTLVMDGGASPAWARHAVKALVDVMPNAQRHTVEGQTHVFAAEPLAPVLAAFFAD